MTRIVLAYSGTLDSSVAIPWLADRYAAEIIAVTIDLGQGKEVLEEIRDRALATGALRAHVIDARDRYLRDHILRGLRAGVLWHRGASMAGALAVPVIAEKLVEIARIEQAPAAAHADAAGAAAPIDRTLRAIGRSLDVKTPAAEWSMTHDEQVEYARQRGVTLPADLIGGVAVRAPGPLPSEPALVEIAFDRGVPIGVNGVTMPIADLIASLDILATAHGVALAAFGLLHVAHSALRRKALGDVAEAFSNQVAGEYGRVLADGSWFTPLRQALDAYVDSIEQEVAGVAQLKLFSGVCTVDDCRLEMTRTALSLAKA
jgi:argininosuccinate synthase